METDLYTAPLAVFGVTAEHKLRPDVFLESVFLYLALSQSLWEIYISPSFLSLTLDFPFSLPPLIWYLLCL